MKCYTCNDKHHISQDCPRSGSDGKTCYKCGEKGHFIRDCLRGAAGGGVDLLQVSVSRADRQNTSVNVTR
jgi:hypothetical protein